MGSSLTWIDYDAAECERMQRIIALFHERETRDELGLGSVRDSFADILFPGTSTIQTRLRYMLIVPWVYRHLENRRVSSAEIAAKARELELDLIQPLLDNDDSEGTVGKTSGRKLKRLPSSIYWSGLGRWGIRRYSGSQDDYHRALDSIYTARGRAPKDDDGFSTLDPSLVTWHPKLPDPPEGFPRELSFRLTREEAQFIQDCLRVKQGDSLLTLLMLKDMPCDCEFPWEHPRYSEFSDAHKETLYHARLFSEAMYGAVLLYNLMLAEELGNELVDQYNEMLIEWASTLNLSEISSWDLDGLWAALSYSDYPIPFPTRRFTEDWVELVRGSSAQDIAMNKAAREMVRTREMRLKGGRSRFTNRRALDEWSGASGAYRLSYRWPTVRRFLHDLHRGLRGDDDDA